jgi:hypothetical protein
MPDIFCRAVKPAFTRFIKRAWGALFIFGVVKEGVSRRGLDPFFFFLTMYLIGGKEELSCCLFAVNSFIRGFV